MDLFEFVSASEYEKSMLRHYRSAVNFINNKSGIFAIVCNPKGAFFRNTIQKMIGIKHRGEIVCQCVLIKHKHFDALMLAFFEAAENTGAAVSAMMEYAERFGRNVGAKRIIAAIDGHCNYSVGFSLGEPSSVPVFGESRNPSYYHSFFREGCKRVGFSCFSGDFERIYRDTHTASRRVCQKERGIALRTADFRKFDDEMAAYTQLNNQIFSGHWYYYLREHDEDLELFRATKPLLSPHNIIFAHKDGKDIGFILFYPDYNELVPIGGKANIATVLRHKLLRYPIHTIKVVEIAVLPEYQATGVIFLLFAEACKQIKTNYPRTKRIVSSWIMDDNHASQSVTKRFAPEIYGRYAAYEKEI